MRSKSLILIALAVGCGLVAAIGLNQVLDAKGKAADQGDRQPVFVAMVDIPPNEELTPQNIKIEEWPKNIVPGGALTKLEEVEGKRCRMKVYAGEPILSSKLLGSGDALGAARDIPPGYRVAHVKIDSSAGSSNLILPGDRVDLVVFRQPQGNMNQTAAKIVLQNIKVFAVDTQTESEFSKTAGSTENNEPIAAKTVALLVTPDQAVLLHAATEMGGSIRLVLRNPDDNAHVTVASATIGDVFGSDQYSSREEEKTPTVEKDASKTPSSLTAWLNEQKEKSPTAPVEAPAAPLAPRLRMTVMLGPQVTQVEIPGQGEAPLNQPQASGGAASSSATPPALDESGAPLPPDDHEKSTESEEEDSSTEPQ